MDTEIQAKDGKGDESGRKSKRARSVAVKVLERHGKSVLVEWMDGDLYKRASVPAAKLAGNDCPADVLEKGVSYGVNWEQTLSDLPGADSIANEFRRQGIWTLDDYKAKRNVVRAVLSRLFIIPLEEEILKGV